MIVPSQYGTSMSLDEQPFTINAVDSYLEDFTTTTVMNGSTTAFGWGSGTVTKDRNFTLSELDFYSTTLPVRGLAVQGRKAYVVQYGYLTSDHTISCFSIEDPSSINFLSERDSLSRTISVAVDGDVVYTGRSQSFNTYNVSNPFDLNGIGKYLDWYITLGNVTDIEPQGQYVYFSNYRSSTMYSFQIMDVADPDDIHLIETDWNNNNTLGLDVSDNFAYIAASTDGFYILDISNKQSPVVVGHIDTPGNATDVLVEGGFAYIADGPGGVHIVDVRNPTNPILLGTCDTPGNARRMKLQGRTLFVADGTGGVQVIDVADKSHPSPVTNIALSYTWDIDLYGGDLVVGTDSGIHTLRLCAGVGITNISEEVYSNTFNQYGASDIKIRGDIAYIAGGADGFYTLNIRDPSNPILLDQINVTNFAGSLEVNEHFAYVIDYNSAFRVFNISNPSNIVETDYSYLTYPTDIAVAGEIAWIADGEYGVYIYNVSNPNVIFILDSFDDSFENVTAISVQGTLLYLAENRNSGSSSCVHVYDIRDIDNPKLLASRLRYDYNYDIEVDGDVMYLAGTSDGNGVWTYNTSNPFLLTLGDNVDRDSHGVSSFGPYLFSADKAAGIALIDAANMDNIVTQSIYPKATAARQVTSHGDFTFIANTTNLIILRHFKSAADTYMTDVSTVQSLEIDSFDSGRIQKATLDFDAYTPVGTSIEFFMSADGGTNWELVTPGISHDFVFSGNELLWKANIIGPEDRSVHLYEVSINFDNSLAPLIDLPWWAYVIAGVGLVALILIVVFIVVIKKKKTRS